MVISKNRTEMHGQQIIKFSKYKFTTKSVFVFFIWFVVSVLQFLFTAKITFLYALFLSVYKIKFLKANSGWLFHLQNYLLFSHKRAVISGNKMPTRCNRGFYCRFYCLLNMFRAPLCPSSGAQEYYTVVAACGILCCGFQVVGLERS